MTAVLVTLEVPDAVAARMSKQDVCDAIADALTQDGNGPVLIGGKEAGGCRWDVVANFGNIPATEADVYSADAAFGRAGR